MALRLTDGTTITDLDRPLQGTRHLVIFGVEESSGEEVVAKIELIDGALEPERRALAWLGAQGGPAPRLRAAAKVESGELPGAVCLLIDRAAGEPPSTPEAWARMGAALARLAQVPWQGSELTTLDNEDFLAGHERRLAELGESLERDLGASLPAVPPAYADSPLTLTHGDPGPGNFLDDGAEGTIIDWEDAVVAPRGLDLGRAVFIALLGSGPEGYVAREPAARAAAVTSGFLAASDWSPTAAELAWWRTVAAIQFAHRRLERAGQPGVLPWQDPLTVLEAAGTV